MRRLRAARFNTDFDSSINTVRALGRFLQGKDHRALGGMGPASPRLARLAAMPPRWLRRKIFVAMGRSQGVPLHRARHISVADIDHWVTRQYGPGPYPVIVVGSASGAVTHLAAALGAPFLPQTTLVAARDVGTHPDDAVGAMDALAPTVRLVARRNPDAAVYHMHDPAQDRPMLQGMAYLRLKRLRLGAAYRRFLAERLAPGGTVLQVECTRTWRTRALGDRAYFQFGCLGGVSEEEYHRSGEGIAKYLADQGSPYRRWEPPEPDARRPEAEWGFDPSWNDDVSQVVDEHGFRWQRLVAEEPQEFSPFVADLHRWWYGRLDRPTNRLLVEGYVQWDPWWMLRLGTMPFWLRFNMEPSYDELERYLANVEPYDEIYLNLFSQGLWSPGVVPIERWRELVQRCAREHGEIIGVDEDAYPVDTGGTLRYQPAFSGLPYRHSMPAPLDVDQVSEFLDQAAGRTYRLSWSAAREPVQAG